MDDVVAKILGFLTAIGIPSAEGHVPETSFVPGIDIAAGTLIFDRPTLRWPGDLLHEAGHIAIMPAALRRSMNGALEDAAVAPHAGEREAIAWSFAAATHLGLDLAVLFHAGGYRGQSAGLLFSFSVGVYPGAFGLAQAGMTYIGAAATEAGIPPYPHMTRWLRE